MGNEEEAKKAFEEGNALYKAGRYAEALACFTRSLELSPDNPDMLNNRGVALDNLGRYEEAWKDYTRALELRPDSPEALDNRGATLGHLKRYEEARKDFTRSLELRPDHPVTLYNRGIVLSSLKRYKEALNDFDDAIKYFTDLGYKADTWHNRGELLYESVRKFKLGWRYKPAVDSFRQALNLDSEAADTHDGLGVSLLKLKKYDEAVKELCRAVELAKKKEDKKSEALFRYNMAVAYCRRNQRERAKRELIASLNLNPDFDAAQKAFDDITSDSRLPWWKWWFGGPASCTCWCKRIFGALLIVALLALIAMPLYYFFKGKPALDWHYYLALLFVVLFFLFMPSIKFLNAFGVGVDIEPQTSPMSTLEPQLSLETSSVVSGSVPRQEDS